MTNSLVSTIEIVNLRNTQPIHPWDFKVDRTNVLGNPWPMKDESQRDKVCLLYATYFSDYIQKNRHFEDKLKIILAALKQYGKVRLFCWCAPKRCHAETIQKWLESQVA